MTLDEKGRLYGFLQTTLLCLFAIAVLFGPRNSSLSSMFLFGTSSIAGAVLSALGVVLILVAIVTIRRAVQIAPQPKEGASLVTTGVYRRFRHPIYTGIVLVVIGLFLRQPTLLTAVAGTVVIAFLAIKVRFEEKLLMARYREYAQYKSQTWGIVPWIS
jgi:protein-S-isoprenylcysteine O-methyltransferase Ste14